MWIGIVNINVVYLEVVGFIVNVIFVCFGGGVEVW